MTRCREFYEIWDEELEGCSIRSGKRAQRRKDNTIKAYLALESAFADRGVPEASFYCNFPESAARALWKEKDGEIREAVLDQIIERCRQGIRTTNSDVVRMRRELRSTKVIAAMPSGKFNVIVIDPPWPYGTKIDTDDRRAGSFYEEIPLDELEKIEIPAADDCVLWLWTTHKFMRHSFPLLDAWGFRDVAVLTWVKDRIGLGSWLRSQSEFCIMAVKGSPIINLTNQTTVIKGPMREHSRKPDEFYDMVDSLCMGKKLDYYSREAREGWDQYGNESSKF